MSGKAPPRGPRALLASLAPGTPTGPAQQGNALGRGGKRIGVAPPTGPRSLTMNGRKHIPPPPPSTPPPPDVGGPGPSTMQNKIATTSIAPPASRAAISFSMKSRPAQLPPQPSYDPPPPPPPESSPPPASPPPPPPPVDDPPPPSRPSSPRPCPLSSPPPRTPAAHSPPSASRISSPPLPKPQLYSLPHPPAFPPSRSHFPSARSYRVIYDPVADKSDRREYFLALIRAIENHCNATTVQDRVKNKGKGKEILCRYEGEVLSYGQWVSLPEDGVTTSDTSPPKEDEKSNLCMVDGIQWIREPKPCPNDPRKDPSVKRRPPRVDFLETKYEFDTNSPHPPPSGVLVVGISPLTPNQHIRTYFGMHGSIRSFEPQIDKSNGSALGIVYVRFSSPEEANTCVKREHGRKIVSGSLLGAGKSSDEELRVVLDGDGTVLKAVMKELDDRRKKALEEKRRLANVGTEVKAGTGRTVTSSSHTPLSSQQKSVPPTYLRNSSALHRPLHPSLPQNPHLVAGLGSPLVQSPLPSTSSLSAVPMAAPLRVRKPSAHVPATKEVERATPMRDKSPRDDSPSRYQRYSSYKPRTNHHYDRYRDRTQSRSRSRERDGDRTRRRRRSSSRSRSRSGSPSPIVRAKEGTHVDANFLDKQEFMNELVRNGNDYVKIDGGAQLASLAREEEVRKFFEGFDVDKVLKSSSGLFVTFQTADAARRCSFVLSSRQLAHRVVTLTVLSRPTEASILKQDGKVWHEDDLLEEARASIMKELKSLLEKDIMERLISADIRRIVSLEKVNAVDPEPVFSDNKPVKKDLKGLSFKKKSSKQEPNADIEEVPQTFVEDDRPSKKPRIHSQVPSDIESEDEILPLKSHKREEGGQNLRKRSPSEEPSVVPPRSRKKVKLDPSGMPRNVERAILVAAETGAPVLSHDQPSSSPSFSPTTHQPGAGDRTPSPSPLISPLDICVDDEDFYLAKLVLSKYQLSDTEEGAMSDSDVPPVTITSRKHVTGSARSEGFYKISHAEKASYVIQYQSRGANTVNSDNKDQHVTSSRSNRANARRRAQGLEEIVQVQRAVALSKGEAAGNEITFKFNQLQTRKKHLRFARSPIHDWGLYAMERISRGEMVIEYVGEIIRAQVAEKREKTYERQGIGSSYLFRIDEDLVVDATKKGNLGRLINHSCDPNCTAKIITISGEKKIVIYAKQDIELGDEITYDYHFPFEQDKIPCLCGSAKCRGFLN